MATNIYASAAIIYSDTPGAGDWRIDCWTSCNTAASIMSVKVTVGGQTLFGCTQAYTKAGGETTFRVPIAVHALAAEAVVITIQSSNSSDTAVTLNTPVAVLIAANAAQIGGNATAANNLATMMGTSVISGTVNDAAATATSFVTDLASAVNDFYAGKILEITTGALAGQSREITAYVAATKTVTVGVAFTSAPANGVAFKILGYIAD